MKDFRKDENGKFICEECNATFIRIENMSRHIKIFHMPQKMYYDKWRKENGEGICKICGNEAKFRSLSHGYNYVCDNIVCLYTFKYNNLINGLYEKYGSYQASCIPEIKEKQQQTCLEKFGVTSPLGSKEIREKGKQTCIEIYGVDNVFKSKEIRKRAKQTKKERYGNENYLNFEQTQKTMEERYGVKSFLELEDVKCNAMLNKHGVKYAQQKEEIHIKQQKSAMKLEYYLNTKIHYRGSYELDFLQKHHPIFLNDLANGPRIEYIFNNKTHYYFSDFIIKSLNLIIEIKNGYDMKRYKEKIEAKAEATIAAGYNYIIIIDKDYKEFNKLYLK